MTLIKNSTYILKFAKYMQTYSILSRVVRNVPIVRFLTITLPLGIVFDLFIAGFRRHFVNLRAIMPQKYEHIFVLYAKAFIEKFNVQALSAFQSLVKTLTVFVNSFIASICFIGIKFYTSVVAFIKYPFVIFLFYYSELYVPFKELIALHAPNLIDNVTLIYNITFILVGIFILLIFIRFLLSLFSLLNQIRLTCVLIVDHIQARILDLMPKVQENKEIKKVPEVKIPKKDELQKLTPQELIALAQKSYKIKIDKDI